MSEQEIQLIHSVGKIIGTAIELRNDADYWERAALHLLLCKKEVEDCDRCQEIKQKLERP